ETDGQGRPVRSTNAKGQVTTLGWDDDNNVTRMETPGPYGGTAVTTWTYDPKTGYPTLIRDAESNNQGHPGTTLRYQTAENGHVAGLAEKTSPEGRTWEFTYTPNGDLETVTDPAGTATTTEGDYTTTYTYDGSGQLRTATDANGNTTEYDDYDANGYPQTITDALGEVTTFAYDVRGQVTAVTDAYQKTTTQTYDTFGRPL